MCDAPANADITDKRFQVYYWLYIQSGADYGCNSHATPTKSVHPSRSERCCKEGGCPSVQALCSTSLGMANVGRDMGDRCSVGVSHAAAIAPCQQGTAAADPNQLGSLTVQESAGSQGSL
ncbi:hypothetical protein M011DRAFT_138552 [Sporormia fimetaria CBS 119925]|uniref:Uncharacterized protein n=1 Tax=Sporormia fimetaria CBS 119925 TaxID=1340428 RepID=A0A6A6V4G6_9PLEO|nr:hypothetical protein M011DRAFT_138552 [Sporormia fimetaria CBS 119925]